MKINGLNILGSFVPDFVERVGGWLWVTPACRVDMLWWLL